MPKCHCRGDEPPARVDMKCTGEPVVHNRPDNLPAFRINVTVDDDPPNEQPHDLLLSLDGQPSLKAGPDLG